MKNAINWYLDSLKIEFRFCFTSKTPNTSPTFTFT